MTDIYTGPRITAEQLQAGFENLAKRFSHSFWRPGDEDCPDEIKAANGEITSLMCKRCGQSNPQSKWCPEKGTPS